VCFPVTSTKQSWKISGCIASTYCCWAGCIRRTATPYNFQHLRWRNTNIWLQCNWDQASTVHRSFRSYPNSTGSSAGGSELRVDFQMAVWMCAHFAFFSNASLEGDSDLTSGVLVAFFYPSFSTRFQHGPWTCSVPPSFWQANDSQLTLAGSVLSRGITALPRLFMSG